MEQRSVTSEEDSMSQENYDRDKVGRIVDALMEHPDGLWLRKLSDEADVPPSTLHRYIEGFLSPLTESVGARDEDGNFFGVRIIRLRSGVRDKLERGQSLDKIIRTNRVLKDRD